jgi:hypothetical protein
MLKLFPAAAIRAQNTPPPCGQWPGSRIQVETVAQPLETAQPFAHLPLRSLASLDGMQFTTNLRETRSRVSLRLHFVHYPDSGHLLAALCGSSAGGQMYVSPGRSPDGSPALEIDLIKNQPRMRRNDLSKTMVLLAVHLSKALGYEGRVCLRASNIFGSPAGAIHSANGFVFVDADMQRRLAMFQAAMAQGLPAIACPEGLMVLSSEARARYLRQPVVIAKADPSVSHGERRPRLPV